MSTTGRNQSALGRRQHSDRRNFGWFLRAAINFASNKICVDLYSAGQSFFFAKARFQTPSETRNLAPRVRFKREECKRSSGIDNFARDAAAIVPNFINSEYARPSLLQKKMNETKEDRGEKERARQ